MKTTIWGLGFRVRICPNLGGLGLPESSDKKRVFLMPGALAWAAVKCFVCLVFQRYL